MRSKDDSRTLRTIRSFVGIDQFVNRAQSGLLRHRYCLQLEELFSSTSSFKSMNDND